MRLLYLIIFNSNYFNKISLQNNIAREKRQDRGKAREKEIQVADFFIFLSRALY